MITISKKTKILNYSTKLTTLLITMSVYHTTSYIYIVMTTMTVSHITWLIKTVENSCLHHMTNSIDNNERSLLCRVTSISNVSDKTVKFTTGAKKWRKNYRWGKIRSKCQRYNRLPGSVLHERGRVRPAPVQSRRRSQCLAWDRLSQRPHPPWEACCQIYKTNKSNAIAM